MLMKLFPVVVFTVRTAGYESSDVRSYGHVKYQELIKEFEHQLLSKAFVDQMKNRQELDAFKVTGQSCQQVQN